MYMEIKETRGSVPVAMYKLKCLLKRVPLYLGLSSLIVTAALPPMIATSRTMDIQTAEEEHAKEIEDATKKQKKYVEDNRKLFDEMSDTEIIMKVTKDMWANIKGYGSPEDEIPGHFDVNVTDKDSYGVCRNMAQYVANVLNYINPNYHARPLNCYMSDGKIKVYNADVEEGVEYKPKELGTVMIGGIDKTPSVEKGFIEGFKGKDLYDKNKEDYDLDAQNKALENVEKIENERDDR